MRYIILLLALVVPSVAFSAGWEECQSGSADGTIGTKQARCVDLTSGDLTTDVLYVGMCENIDVLYNPDTGGSGVAISVTPYTCFSKTASTSNCTQIAGLTLSGTPPNTEIYGAAAEWIYFVGSGVIGSETPRILVRCNP